MLLQLQISSIMLGQRAFGSVHFIAMGFNPLKEAPGDGKENHRFGTYFSRAYLKNHFCRESDKAENK
jgi:hypothetical protein